MALANIFLMESMVITIISIRKLIKTLVLIYLKILFFSSSFYDGKHVVSVVFSNIIPNFRSSGLLL